jgi:hypothetical protein
MKPNIGFILLKIVGWVPLKIEEILRLNNEVVRMITSTISTIRSKRGSTSVRENHADYTADGNVILDD